MLNLDNIPSSGVMKKLSSNVVATQSMKYVDDRRKGLITSLRTKFPRLNSALMGGIETNTITCISALSGAGKSTISKCITDSICTMNEGMDFNLYKFNFEMVAFQTASRSIVTDANMPLRKLYSVDEPLTEEEYQGLIVYYEQLKKRDNVWFIETPSNAATIVQSLLIYYRDECKPYGKTLLYEIDHALLTKGNVGDKEKERIDDLMYRLVELKKIIAADGGSSVGIVLSQMNREIRSVERIKNAELHRPSTGDLFGASSIEQCADYIIFSHMPAKLGIQAYTTEKYPTRVLINNVWINIPYFELVKQRSGESDITFPMWNKLDRFDFDEMDLSIFRELHSSFKERGQCVYDNNQLKFHL